MNVALLTVQFLGWFYRELRQSLVDLDAFLKVGAEVVLGHHRISCMTLPPGVEHIATQKVLCML